MAHQHLDGPQVDPGFEEMGSEAVTQRMEPTPTFDPGTCPAVFIDALGTPHGQVAVPTREEPVLWTHWERWWDYQEIVLQGVGAV